MLAVHLDFVFMTPAWLLTLALIGASMLVLELGFRGGLHEADSGARMDDSFGRLCGAVISLTVFLLAFSFNFAASRYETRRDQMEAEAAAIGTAWLRAQQLPVPQGAQLLGLFPEYVDARIGVYENETNPAEGILHWQAANRLQARMWKIGGEAAAAEPANRRCDAALSALTDMFDRGDIQSDTRRNHVPPAIYGLLFCAVLLSALMTGYDFGRARKRSMPSWILFTLFTGLVIFVILDLDRPERGLITTSKLPLQIVRRTMLQKD